ncbi:MBL fold metallo-hydrolase [Streptomyces sp. NPDC051940]|uniref:pyrroloquinoline quinone biosynthesis protein PqqB n=1 Tax=Streptomyces sp. NPDC051940 TaxID=3155675 RepID=UPI0034187B67
MLLRVLGTAAGGGVPQWNCACPGCRGARVHRHWRRRHAALAVRSAPGRWFLVNATPDLGEQLEEHPELHPGPEPRRTPVAGVLLTDAELDHTLGIARLREGDALHLHTTGAVRHALHSGLRLDDVLAPYTGLTWHRLPHYGSPEPLEPGSEILVDALPVSGKRPRYAAGLPDDADGTWSVALRLTDRATGRRVLYAPCIATWPDALGDAAERADVVFADGTFWDDEEPVAAGLGAKSATAMGHLPIQATAERLSRLPGRCLYTHLNNTNPLVDPADPRHRQLAELGLDVAEDGMVIEL